MLDGVERRTTELETEESIGPSTCPGPDTDSSSDDRGIEDRVTDRFDP